MHILVGFFRAERPPAFLVSSLPLYFGNWRLSKRRCSLDLFFDVISVCVSAGLSPTPLADPAFWTI